MSVWVPWADAAFSATAAEHGPVLAYIPESGPPGPADEVEFWALPHPPAAGMLPLLARMPRLSVVQLLSSGVDHVVGHLAPGVTLCNAPQLRSGSTAEAAMCLILAALNRMREWFAVQQRGEWEWLEPRPGLRGSTVVLVGYGNVGQALHRMLDGFDVRVVPVARRGRPGVAAVAELPEFLPTADVVVLAAPLTAQSRGMFDRAMLRRMKAGALLVNVARGELVDTGALLEALRGDRLAAALDVVDPEPLPAGHPLWTAPHVLISPHVGGNSAGLRDSATAFLAQQIDRFCRRQPLENRVTSVLHDG